VELARAAVGAPVRHINKMTAMRKIGTIRAIETRSRRLAAGG
jgi:hypothetical protein